MDKKNWIDEFPGMISVCDPEGKIMVMNQKIIDYFTNSGGSELIGTNLFDCHGKESGEKVRNLLVTQQVDVYVAEENGKSELVIHSPLFNSNGFTGLVEISIPLDHPIRTIKR